MVSSKFSKLILIVQNSVNNIGISNEFAVTWGSALTLRILTKRYLIERHGVEVGAIRSP